MAGKPCTLLPAVSLACTEPVEVSNRFSALVPGFA